VSSAVGNTKNNSPDLLLELNSQPAGLFSGLNASGEAAL